MPLTGAAAARLYDDHVESVYALVTRRVGPGIGPDVTEEVFEQAVRSWDRFDSAKGTERLFLFGIATTVLRRHTDEEREYLLQLRSNNHADDIVNDPLVTTSPSKTTTEAATTESDDSDSGSDQADSDSESDSDKAGVDDLGTDTTDEATGTDVNTDGDPQANGNGNGEPERVEPEPVDEVAAAMAAVVALAPDDRDVLLLSTWEGCTQGAIAEALDLTSGAVRSTLTRVRRELKKSVGAAEQRSDAADAKADADTDTEVSP